MSILLVRRRAQRTALAGALLEAALEGGRSEAAVEEGGGCGGGLGPVVPVPGHGAPPDALLEGR